MRRAQRRVHENKMFDPRFILVASAASFMNLSAASIGVTAISIVPCMSITTLGGEVGLAGAYIQPRTGNPLYLPELSQNVMLRLR
jgi:ABC-type Fe3+-siderophore transport system permease subunit